MSSFPLMTPRHFDGLCFQANSEAQGTFYEFTMFDWFIIYIKLIYSISGLIRYKFSLPVRRKALPATHC